jgi:hypothetical protein
MPSYKVDNLCNEHNVRVYAQISYKLMNLDAEYKFALADVKINLVAFIELKLATFLILLDQKELRKDTNPKGAKQFPNCIFYSFNKFSNVLINDLPKSLPFCRKVDHKIEMVPISALRPKHLIG